MQFNVNYLSFFVIMTDAADSESGRKYKHFQTLDEDDYSESELKSFLDGEFVKICKRKVEKNPSTDAVPTKIGRFIVEPGYDLGSNPNFNLMQRLREAQDKEEFLGLADEMLRIYMETSAVRGGAFIVADVQVYPYFDQPLLFVMKCDFESKIARISDERSLISHVEMAISARNIKSIQYPHMPEEGMLDEWELKIHQASHARYFEDFLKFVTYEKPMPEIINEQVFSMVQQYMEEKWEAAPDNEQGRHEEEQSLEIWAASDKRELQEKWSHDLVVEAASQLTQHKPDLDLRFKVGGVAVKGQLADYGASIHLARHNGRYIAVIEGDAVEFEKGKSPVELLHPQELMDIIELIGNKRGEEDQEAD
ncbi:DUF3900 domain-containing protein [Paenibacillus sp. GCM10012307]|uniref:DUF3900 domain-containing protein n=1 Tax=Paenibacillus roseus TaxID=2798579 RepID=A0A934MTB1_9BACL|nr:DUF3900 domain-containing protein [Paenibacillus roseus]MBJ6364059.1 DUF3900 domain-containing protein [Paenibacillus roseus]